MKDLDVSAIELLISQLLKLASEKRYDRRNLISKADLLDREATLFESTAAYLKSVKSLKEKYEN